MGVFADRIRQADGHQRAKIISIIKPLPGGVEEVTAATFWQIIWIRKNYRPTRIGQSSRHGALAP